MIGNRPLIETVPLYRDAKSGDIMTQYDMRCVEKVGLIKFDFLGLKTLTVIADAEKLIRATHADFCVEKLPLDDERTFILSARADRIERRLDGTYAILDYKTGQPPTGKQVRMGLSPQLTLEAAILREGGFEGIDAGSSVGELVYVRLSGNNPPG